MCFLCSKPLHVLRDEGQGCVCYRAEAGMGWELSLRAQAGFPLVFWQNDLAGCLGGRPAMGREPRPCCCVVGLLKTYQSAVRCWWGLLAVLRQGMCLVAPTSTK